jgi:hypothetical protein
VRFFLPLTPSDDCPDRAGKIEEVPVGLLDFPAKFASVKISDASPAGKHGFRLYRQVRGQRRVLADEDGPNNVIG